MSTAIVTMPGTLFSALAKAQAKMRNAAKDAKNPHFNSKYADLASIWEACRDALTENGIAVIQEPVSDDKGRVGCVTTLGHASGEERRSAPLWTTPRDQGPQAVGSCVTYLRRYQLAAMVGVAPDDDDGNAGTRGSDSYGPPKGAPAPKAQAEAPAAETSAKSVARANLVPHDGKMASHKQVVLLHILRDKVGITPCDGGCAKPVKKFSKSAGGLVDKTVYCVYHTQLSAFKDQQGKPITTSKDLSEAQISNLISRYEAKLAQQEANPPEPININDINAPEPGKVSSEGVASIMNAASGKPDLDIRELLAVFGADQISELSTDDAGSMLALVLAYGTDNYARVLDDVRTHAGRT